MQKAAFISILLPLLACSLAFQACKKDKPQVSRLSDVSSYVYAYTSGVISKTSPIRTRFTKEVVREEEVGKEVQTDVFSIRPNVKGTAVWEDTRTLLFEPETTFQSGTDYTASIALRLLFEKVPSNASTFNMAFRTKEMRYAVHLEGLRSENDNDLKNQELHGLVYTSDQAGSDLVEKSMVAQQDGESLNVDWLHLDGNKRHEFIVSGISRGANASEVQLDWNADPLGIEDKGSEKISVPALGEFKITNAEMIQSGDAHIVLNFSDPLLKSQELDGLVSISDYSGNLRFLIDGNLLRIYPASRINGNRRVRVRPGIKNINGVKMAEPSVWNIQIIDVQPQIRLAGKGIIMPNSEGLIFPFEAVSLNAIDVEVFKIYDNNILQFLQTNEIDGAYDMERVGRIILQEKVNLKDLNSTANAFQWTRYALDLSKMIHEDPYAIYQIRLGFRPAYSLYNCGAAGALNTAEELTVMKSVYDKEGEFISIWGDYYGIEGIYDDYQWEHRNNPCFPAYFNYDRFVRRNVLASDLGIIAKRGKGGNVMVAVSDINTTYPIPEVQLEFYDYQQQLMATAATDGEGLASINLNGNPFAVIASKGGQKGYLRLMDQNTLSLSRFDVTGVVSQKGIKGFLYAERGVWRPGDSIYLNFVLEDKAGKLPAGHPVNFELIDSKGQVQKKWTTSENVNNVYPLAMATAATAPTGNWTAKVQVGGATFTKNLRIETVKPNRLKIDLDFGKEKLAARDSDLTGDLQVNWLHGAPARNVAAKIEVQVKATNTTFDKYKEYEFDDPAREYQPQPVTIFDQKVNDDGHASVLLNLDAKNAAPGKLQAHFRTRAFEKGGDFSTDNYIMPYSPYDTYAGVFIKKNKYGEKRLDISKEGKIELIVVDEEGNPQAGRNLKVGLYRVDWRWWWDRGRDNITKYNSATHFGSIKSGTLRTNGKGETDWSIKVDDWGRYLVRVCDAQSGHCAGDIFYAGYPWYDEENGGQNRDAAAMLAFSADKDKYEVGDKVELSIPSSDNGRALISIENGSSIIESYWTNTANGETKFSFYATEAMAPTVYANVSLIQPHAQSKNDLPIRLYGVIPINVEDSKTRLNPELEMPKVLEPDELVELKISETKGNPMAYTIAMVDEGLLDLTRFKTPNPWNAFYAREALGVKTWDVYDYVLGAYGGELERVLAIGGAAELRNAKAENSANRFKAVVKHLGPFYLERGSTAEHQIKVPNYVGSVRTMVVASNKGSYGSAESTTPVRKPLMVLATLPRVLGPTERLTLPITVFAMESGIKNAKVTVEEHSGLINFIGETTQQVSFAKPGETLTNFELEVGERVGVAKFKITATGAGETATQDIEIQVRNPNPFVSDIQEKVLQPGESWNTAFEAIGVPGTNKGILEVSNIPPIDLGKRLNFLIQYPHGCIEQTISSGFPQLYVSKLMEVEEAQKRRIDNNITATIERLKLFQTSNGGFGYWPGDNYASTWGTNYAGHFMLETSALGYSLPAGMLNRWKSYQKRQANNWNYGDNHYDNELTQAYRLYTLALANSPELGSMNRLREDDRISDAAKWRLAAAYAQIGRNEVAKELANSLNTTVKDYTELAYTYGSGLRDEAMILEALVQMKDLDKAGNLAKRISTQLSSGRWYGTQTVAYSLLAIGKFVGNTVVGDRYNFAYQLGNNQLVNAGANTPIMNIEIPVDGNNNKALSLKNNSQGVLYVKLLLNGQPLIGDQTAKSENLKITVEYLDINGNIIDPSRLEQGADFVAQVAITNPGNRGIRYDEMALTQVFPSGWEVLNTRMSNIERFSGSATPDYQDIRDDRVYTYFDINRKSTQIYTIQLNAAYEGRYYLPTVSCEAMYDNTIHARQPGQWVEVISGKSL